MRVKLTTGDTEGLPRQCPLCRRPQSPPSMPSIEAIDAIEATRDAIEATTIDAIEAIEAIDAIEATTTMLVVSLPLFLASSLVCTLCFLSSLILSLIFSFIFFFISHLICLSFSVSLWPLCSVCGVGVGGRDVCLVWCWCWRLRCVCVCLVCVAIECLRESRSRTTRFFDPFDHLRHLIKLFSSSCLTRNSRGTSFFDGSIGLSFPLPKSIERFAQPFKS